MLQTRSFHDYLEQVHQAGAFDDIWDVLNQYRRSRALPGLIYVHFPPLGALDQEKPLVAAEGFPEDWLQNFVAKDYANISPVLEHAKTAITPFLWSSILTDDLLRTATSPDVVKCIEDFRAFDVGDGLGFPLYGPMGRRALCSVGLRHQVVNFTPALMQELQILFQSAHLRYCDLIQQRQSQQADLSPREVEILSWVARGKSNSVIAHILDVSAHTVDTHMRRIYAKLNVTDRVAAAIYGVGAGILR